MKEIAPTLDLGATLKTFRAWTQMSIRDVAAKAGCSVAVISKIELNQISPTVRTLEKICAALEVTVSDFLRPPTVPFSKPIIVPAQRETCEAAMRWSSARMLRVIPADKINFTALLIHLDTGGRTTTRQSRLSHAQLCFVLKGQLALESEGVAYPVRQSEAIYFNTMHQHAWVNTGETMAELLVVNPYRFMLFEQIEENMRWRLREKRERRKQKVKK